jgi:hypothetical protein
MSNAARNQKTYRDRLRAEVFVLRAAVARDTIIDLIHAAGVVMKDYAAALAPRSAEIRAQSLSISRTEQHRDDLLAADKVAR